MNLDDNKLTPAEYMYTVTEAEFNSKVIEKSADIPVLVDFWADWCGPCKALMPILEGLVSKYAGQFYLAKINADEEQSLTMQLGVRSLPTVVLFKDGQPVENFMGVLPESEIVALIEPHLEVGELVADEATEQAHDAGLQGLIDSKQWQDALLQVQSLDGDEKVWWETKILIAQNEFEQAEQSMAAFSDELKASERGAKLGAELQLRQLSNNADNVIQKAIDVVLNEDVNQGVEALLDLLSKDNKNKDVRAALLSSFLIIDDSKQVSKYRRTMASFVF